MRVLLSLLIVFSLNSYAEIKVFYPDEDLQSQQPALNKAPKLPEPLTQMPAKNDAPTEQAQPESSVDESDVEESVAENPAPKEPAKPDWLDRLLGIKAVKPWQKGYLASNALSPEGSMPSMNEFRQKVFVSKENTNGGYGISGSGCGCN